MMVAMVALFASCAMTKKSADESRKELFAEWIITDVKGEKAVGEDTPTLALEEGRVHGNTGCNYFNGTMLLDGERISFSQVGVTRRFCVNAVSEGAILESLNSAYSYRLRKEFLYIYDAKGNCIMKLKK